MARSTRVFFSSLVKVFFVVCISSNIPNIDGVTDAVTGQLIQFNLSSYNKSDPTSHLFQKTFSIRDVNLVININHVPESIGFFVIQVHTFKYNVTLSSTPTVVPHYYITGTNTGLVQMRNAGSSYQFFVRYDGNRNDTVLIVITAYDSKDPIPGGCNLTFNTEIAPYQLVSYTSDVVTVDAQSASVMYNHSCQDDVVHLDMYHMFLKERSLDEQEYFDAIQKMLTPERIRQNGRKVPVPIGHTNLRTLYSAYQGVGSVYAIIATYGNFCSVYVPAVTYACDILNWSTKCEGPVTVEWKILCAVLLFVGFFSCFLAHKSFTLELFIFGFIFGGLVSYILADENSSMTSGESLTVIIVFGLLYGIMEVIFWCCFGSPILSIVCPLVLVGFSVASMIFYTSLGDAQLFQSDLNYWGIFSSVTLIIVLVLMILISCSNTFVCTFLGASCITIVFDHYVGANLRYIFVNTVRRATVPHFNTAVIDAPFQYKDIILSVVFALLLIAGIRHQSAAQRGRPPYPPPPCTPRNLRLLITERTPLLRGTVSSYSGGRNDGNEGSDSTRS